MTHWKRLLVLGLLVPTIAAAQEPTTPAPTASLQPAPTAGLSLADAFSTALAKNPDYLQWLNNESPANMAVKSAYASFVPSASVSGGFNYTGSGSSNFGGTNVVKTSASVGSSYSIDLDWTLDGRVLDARRDSRKANLRATKEQIQAANVSLRAAVQTAVPERPPDERAHQRGRPSRWRRNKVFLDLAKARYQVGQATMLDVRQAEVTLGQSEVDLLVAQQQNADARLELFRLMGVSAPDGLRAGDADRLVPGGRADLLARHLLATAAQVNPNLLAAEAASDATKYNLSAVKGEYFPSLRAGRHLGRVHAGVHRRPARCSTRRTAARRRPRPTAPSRTRSSRGLTYGPGGMPGHTRTAASSRTVTPTRG